MFDVLTREHKAIKLAEYQKVKYQKDVNSFRYVIYLDSQGNLETKPAPGSQLGASSTAGMRRFDKTPNDQPRY
jgi:hypothetical protein